MKVTNLDSNNEWVKINRHLQRVGTATSDVSNIILLADEAKAEGNSRWSFVLMSAARCILNCRARVSKEYSAKLSRKPIPLDRWN